MIDLCSKCQCSLDDFNKSSMKTLCRACYSAYKRNYLKDPNRILKHKARLSAKSAKEKGILIQIPCMICGSSESEMHHPDYSKPLDISWLCRECHNEIHVLDRKYASR